MKNIYIACLILSICSTAWGQIPFCGHKKMRAFYHLHEKPASAKEEEMNQQILRAFTSTNNRSSEVYELPVVFHLLEEEGAEPISHTLIYREVQFLNQAFNNQGAYYSPEGKASYIQFYLANLSPTGQPTNGIIHHQTPYSTLHSYEEDIRMKDSFHWDTHHYINIYLINKGPATAYAHLPHFHGRSDDGIVITYPHIGQQEALSTPLIHEMGHYLGLYHTFEGGCKNQSCLVQGDRVCDTPPDAGTQFFEGCAYNNSCNTDADDHSEHNKFHEDHHDLNNNFMDYNRGGCLQSFTPGQIARMRLSIEEIRQSLLDTPSHVNRNKLAITQVSPEILQENQLPNRLTTAVFHTGESGVQSLKLETIQDGKRLSFQTRSQYMLPYSSYEISWTFPPTLQFAPFKLRLTKETLTESLIQEWDFQTPEWDVSTSAGLDILEASIIPGSPTMASALGCMGSPLFRFQLADEPLIDSHEYLFLNFGVGENTDYLPLNLQVSFDPNIPIEDSLQLWVSYDLGENWQKEAWGVSPEELAALNLQKDNSHSVDCADWESLRISLPSRTEPYQAQLRYQSFGKGVSMAFSTPSLLSTEIDIQEESQLLSLNIGSQQWNWMLPLRSTSSFTADLSDLQGKKIPLKKESGGNGELQLSTAGGIPAGIYFLILSSEVERLHKKIMVY